MLLTVERLLSYLRCPRRTFLDIYGDRTLKAPPSDFLLKLQQERLVHENFVLTEQISQGATPHIKPDYQKGDWQTGVKATVALMQQGVERIYQGVLSTTIEPSTLGLNESPLEELTLLSSPDLLIKQPGKSYFGDWVYIPIDIHLGKRPKQEYQIIAAYHTQNLAAVQGAWSEEAWLILRERGSYQVDLWRWLPELQIHLKECFQMLLEKQEPEVFISRQQCSICPWQIGCHELATSQQHLSLLPGVTPKRYEHLKTLRLTSLESLADANPVYLEPEMDAELAQQIVRQAQAVLTNQVLLVPSLSNSTKVNIPTADIEIYFDIEAEPSLNLDYLLGILVVDKIAQTEKFYPVLAEKPEDQQLIWQQFLDLIEAYPNAPIFHYSPYETDTIKRLAKLYKTPYQQIEPVLSRCVDLHQELIDTVTLPLHGYSLKLIANWLGFNWRDPLASGSQSICWYDEWLQKGDRTLLDLILRYNEDDCRATRHVKDWLVEFLQDTSQDVVDKPE
ncbi:RecB family nuclease, putative [Crinalium epipsammum PCC 9333]|uniref:RecB family nuclease, putative n=1 Tax=Crinalium epipsammum PCC 9333 TaxID=1173022 RepID=K9W389_9CYAN|nr:TM0106 family RecB-like putative nuclease [Crinalium epipsammum]AFZ14823.1 RecB family nuclease, putative [Crinalium epipsammum PCC 9333]